ncbi:MAG TPA: peptidoglycan-binding protein [Candidatus Paceibacterota bacterium]
MKNITSRFFVGAGLATVMMVMPLMASAATLYRQLELGMSGSDVRDLQTFLAQDVTIYPQGLVTGYFGFLTKAAVSNFQVRNGIANVGRVGPITLVAINAQMLGGVTTGASAPMITGLNVAVSSNGATVNWNTNEFSKGVVYYSTSPLVTYERTNSVDVSGSTAMTDTNFKSSQSVSISGLSANTTYYYMVYTTDQGGNVSVSWPSTFHTNN